MQLNASVFLLPNYVYFKIMFPLSLTMIAIDHVLVSCKKKKRDMLYILVSHSLAKTDFSCLAP